MRKINLKKKWNENSNSEKQRKLNKTEKLLRINLAFQKLISSKRKKLTHKHYKKK